jgi:hypothetical protein
MENIKNYQDFIFEAKGISPAIYKDLQEYFKSTDEPTFDGANNFLNKSGLKWHLSEEDYDEAEAEFKEKPKSKDK